MDLIAACLGLRASEIRLSIYALQQLHAKEAFPELRLLTEEDANIHFDGLGTVAKAAKSAISKLEAMR